MGFPNNTLIEILLEDQIIAKSWTCTTQQYSSNRLNTSNLQTYVAHLYSCMHRKYIRLWNSVGFPQLS